MKQLLKKAKQISILILALSLISCDNDDDANLPEVVAGFTYTLNIDTGTVTFINISESSRTYLWGFGDGTNSTEINPIKTYANGTYTVSLKASNVAGASDTFEDEITILIPEIATLPITFDGENTSYNAETFGGVSFEIVDNPDLSGSNTSASKVGAITNIGAQFEGFYFDLGSNIDLSTLSSISMNFWADSPVDVLMKLEEGTGGPVEATAGHGGTGWEVIYFTFDSTASYSRLTLFVDGPGTTAGTFYLDDIMQINTADIPCPETDLELPIDFDCNGIDYAVKIVGNVSFEVVDNPELSGINSDPSKVGKMTNTGQNWENAFFNLDTAIDFTTDKGIRFKMFSDQALPIKLKLEDGTEAPVEVDVNHTGSGWEELTFTFISTASYNDMIIFVDGPGTAAGTFYIDDIEQVAGDVAEPCIAESMQSLAGADFNLTFMSDPTASIIEDGGDFEWIDNPDFDNDVNKSCKVGKITKLGNNPWDNNQIDLDEKLDFNANEGLKIKVWSGVANSEVRIKLEEIGNAGNNVEQFLTTSLTGAWEELIFPFTSADSNKFNKIVIFFDLNAGNTDTYYFDDLALYGSGGGGGGSLVACNGGDLINDFESSDNSIFNNFGGGVGTIEANTDTSENTSATVAQYVKNTGEVFAGITIGLDSNIDFDAGVFSIDVSSQAVRQLLFKLEGLGIEVIMPTSGAGWETIEYDFSEVPGNVGAVTGITLIMDNGTAGDGTGDWTILFDNIRLCSNGGSGGGDCPAPPAGELLSNGDFEAGESCWQFFSGTSISTTVNNGGSNSAELQGAPGAAVGIKQERFAVGIIQPNTSYTVTFDIIASGEFGEGGVFKVFTFSEGADGGPVAATQHILADGISSLPTIWTPQSYTFISAPNADQVEGGLSFYMEIVNSTSSVTLNVDNVVVKQTP